MQDKHIFQHTLTMGVGLHFFQPLPDTLTRGTGEEWSVLWHVGEPTSMAERTIVST